MITQNNINFENPKKVKLYDLIDFYISNLKKYNYEKKNLIVKIKMKLILKILKYRQIYII
jgi:hypothetical protein